MFGVGKLWRWFRDLLSIPEVQHDQKQLVVLPPYPLAPVVEALARQRALAEQRLRGKVKDRELEQGRRMACMEVAKELGIHDDVTERTYELRRRR